MLSLEDELDLLKGTPIKSPFEAKGVYTYLTPGLDSRSPSFGPSSTIASAGMQSHPITPTHHWKPASTAVEFVVSRRGAGISWPSLVGMS